jgi:hypothetical protein
MTEPIIEADNVSKIYGGRAQALKDALWDATHPTAACPMLSVAKNRSIRSTLRDRGDLIGDRPMTANRDEPRPTPFMQWVAAEPLALIFGIVAIPVLAIALGVCVTILANAFR